MDTTIGVIVMSEEAQGQAAAGAESKPTETRVIERETVISKDVPRLGKFKLEKETYTREELMDIATRYGDSRAHSVRPEVEKELEERYGAQLGELSAAKEATARIAEMQVAALPEVVQEFVKDYSDNPVKQLDFLSKPSTQKILEQLTSKGGAEFGKELGAGEEEASVDKFYRIAMGLQGQAKNEFLIGHQEELKELQSKDINRFHELMRQ